VSFANQNYIIILRITFPAYEKYHYPWYKLYDENVASIYLARGFARIKTVHDLDSEQVTPVLIFLDPEAPPPCTSHSEAASVCIFRPCSHYACAACLGMAMINNSKCCLCNCTISKFVGFKKPIPKVHTVTDCDEDGWTVEKGIVGVQATDDNDDNVITLFLDEDRVAKLHSPTFNGVSCICCKYSE